MAKQTFSYPYPRPMVTVDAIIFRSARQGVELLLIERKHAPYAGAWALPGGFVDMEESLEAAVARELKEETGLEGISLRQCHAFGDPGRDPRGRTISVAYLGEAPPEAIIQAGDDAAEARWFPLSELPPLAFDHQQILDYALNWQEENHKYENQESDGLIIVDVQNDFCPGGALPVLGGDAVVPVINRVMIHFSHLFFSQDWHPGDHCSFSDTPEYVDKSWPPHCVENTPGAEFHGDLRVPLDATFIRKGVNRDEEAYSAFHGTDLEKRLREKNIKRVFVAGLATDYCVRSTALDALKAGFETVIIEDACRGIADESVVEALQEITSQGATRCCSGDME